MGIDQINNRISDMEVKADRTEKSNNLRFDAINSNVARIETTVTDRVVETIDPQIKSLKNELKADLSTDLRALVQEEINRRFPEINREDEATKDKNNKNLKKKIKPIKPK